MLNHKIRFLVGTEIAMGPGKADLLEEIDKTGSISAAARNMGMSYRRAWDLVDTMNRCFVTSLVEAATGGEGGGGARVTDFGRSVVMRYRNIQVKATAHIAEDALEFFRINTQTTSAKK